MSALDTCAIVSVVTGLPLAFSNVPTEFQNEAATPALSGSPPQAAAAESIITKPISSSDMRSLNLSSSLVIGNR